MLGHNHIIAKPNSCLIKLMLGLNHNVIVLQLISNISPNDDDKHLLQKIAQFEKTIKNCIISEHFSLF